MKTFITITGSGIMSKRTLLRACTTSESTYTELGFNNYKLEFKTKTDAIKALSEAYQHLKSNTEDWWNSAGSYVRASSLEYDAGIATITNNN